MQFPVVWNRQLTTQFNSNYFAFYYNSGTGVLPNMGIWLLITNTEQPIYWQNYSYANQTGDVRPIWPGATAGAAVAAVIRTRSIQRFVFGRVFGRIN